MIDYKKEQKELYQPKTTPSIVDVPEMVFIMVDGKGDPNTSEDFHTAVEVLYGLSYSIKMSKKSGAAPEGYFEYVVPPLEGLWDLENARVFPGEEAIPDKSDLVWIVMIRQPEFVTTEVFEAAKAALAKKKPGLDTGGARLELFTEGLCAQVMHLGSYDDEPATLAMLNEYIEESGYTTNKARKRRHHEIYLSDPNKTVPEKLKTVLRHPIK